MDHHKVTKLEIKHNENRLRKSENRRQSMNIIKFVLVIDSEPDGMWV